MQLIQLHPDRVLRRLQGRPFGINVNYLRDHDLNRPEGRPLQDAVLEMGAGHLRYPGGEKSDWVLFERGRPKPIGWYATAAVRHELMDLDAFVALCRATRAQPHVVVAYDSQARTGISEDQYLNNALNLLRYANLEQGYGIVYWELGNENWHNQTASPQEMARVVARFSTAMKALDPAIKICASGAKPTWWQPFLSLAGEHVDCLTVSQYSCMDWGSYDYFARHEQIDLVGNAREAIAAVKRCLPERAADISVIVTELNSKDYADLFKRPFWADDNNLGHAVVNCCIIGQLLELPEVAYGMIWTTRWMDQHEAQRSIWYGLDGDNRLLPSAQPLMLLSRFLKDEMIACEAPQGFSAFASRSADGQALSLFVVNRQLESLPMPPITVAGGGYALQDSFLYSGSGPDDLQPELRQLGPQLEVPDMAPAVSITILEYRRE